MVLLREQYHSKALPGVLCQLQHQPLVNIIRGRNFSAIAKPAGEQRMGKADNILAGHRPGGPVKPLWSQAVKAMVSLLAGSELTFDEIDGVRQQRGASAPAVRRTYPCAGCVFPSCQTGTAGHRYGLPQTSAGMCPESPRAALWFSGNASQSLMSLSICRLRRER